ncbi:protein neprosin-like [Cicer arietinum]|uniref:protein neprosin-like n=1 Tax=Cicer arietinum TaxID=3827 RepID=UPI003CC52929
MNLYPTFETNITRSRPYSTGKNVEGCPIGKVPIHKKTRRPRIVTNSSSKSLVEDFQQYSQSSHGYHSVSLDTTQNMIFHGAHAEIGGYNLSLKSGQYSISSIWVQNGPPTKLNSIQAGIGFHPSIYGDSQLRLIGHWTVDGQSKTGCYTHACPGFVQVNPNKKISLGAVQSPVSSIGSLHKWLLDVRIKQDRVTGHWWLIVEEEQIHVGYWPKTLFTHLSNGASLIKFGGETYAPPNMDNPPMGSGRLPQEGFRNSGFIGTLDIIDSNFNEIDVKHEEIKKYSDANSKCYDLRYNGYQGSDYRQAFLYGGPGGSSCGI